MARQRKGFRAKNESTNGGKQSDQDGLSETRTRLGIKEKDYVRPSRAGNYTPNINEFDDLVIEGKLSPNESKVFFYIKKNTVNFQNTEFRCKRKKMQDDLKLDSKRLWVAIKSLGEKRYIIERADGDDYYLYSLDPHTFKGIIVLKSCAHASFRLNRNTKSQEWLNDQKNYGKMPFQNWQNAIATMAKCHSKSDLSVGNQTPFQTLKYILIKYILINKASEEASSKILEVINQSKSPPWVIKKLVSIMHQDAWSMKVIIEVILSAHESGIDPNGKELQVDPVFYAITYWEKIKIKWNNYKYQITLSPGEFNLRQNIYDAIQAFPEVGKVIPLQTKDLKNEKLGQ